MRGTFKNLDELKTFTSPMKIIGSLMGEHGFNILVSKNEDESIETMISAKNRSVGVVIHHRWKTLFNDFEIDENEFKLGFMNSQDLICRLNLLENDEIKMEVDSNRIMSFKQKRMKLEFNTSDPELIVNAKKNFDGIEWVGSFSLTNEMDKFLSALKVMNKEDVVSFTGVEEKGKLKIEIKNSQQKRNTFKYIIDATVNENFSINFKKDLISNILSCKDAEEVSFNISTRMMNINVKTNYGETNYYVSKLMI